jgi:hypothetical protein
MINAMNVHGLPERDVRQIELMVGRLRIKANREKQAREEDKKEIVFSAWPLGESWKELTPCQVGWSHGMSWRL